MLIRSVDFYAGILSRHFQNDFACAFAYGSGVFKQKASTAGMVDFLLAVEDSDWTHWHARNRERNPRDYPSHASWTLSLFPPKSIYFVPNVCDRSGQQIKYGVVRYSDLRNDLFTWSQLYLAGRLQKPTLHFQLPESLHEAVDFNYESAIRVAMILAKRDADFCQVMEKLVGLSYGGDPRVHFAEAPGKVGNIVKGQLAELEAIYSHRFERLEEWRRQLGDTLWREGVFMGAPATLRARLRGKSDSASLSVALKSIVKWPAWRQMLLGSLSTPPMRALSYASAKVKKRFS